METKNLQEIVAGNWPATSVRGVATTAMLSAAGISDKTITAAAAKGLIIRLHRGAYIQSMLWRSLAPWEREDATLTGHVLASRSSGIYSHSSAARMHGLRTWGSGSAVHLTHGYAPGTSGHNGQVITHQQAYDPDLITMMRIGPVSVPVTSMVQTVLDCGRHFDLERSTIIGDHALRCGASLAQLREELERSCILRGSARARNLLEFLDPLSESAGESRTRVFLSAARLPMPELQVRIQTRHGLHRADFAWRQYRLILEFDGWGKYFDYQPTPVALAMERKREKDLMELGWSFIRIDWQDLKDPVALEARIRAALNRGGAKLPLVRTPVFL